MTMSAILADISALVTGSVTWMTEIVGFITDNPLVLLFTLVGFVGIGIGLIHRLIR